MTEIEDQLRALSERWAHTCQWSGAQLQRLQRLQDAWAQLDARHGALLHECDGLETTLKQVYLYIINLFWLVWARRLLGIQDVAQLLTKLTSKFLRNVVTVN